jgi:hypothetical protein
MTITVNSSSRLVLSVGRYRTLIYYLEVLASVAGLNWGNDSHCLMESERDILLYQQAFTVILSELLLMDSS